MNTILNELKKCPICQQEQLVTTPDSADISLLCMYCGFLTSSKFHTTNTDIIKTIVPYVMKYRHIDESQYIWIPFTLTIPSVGSLFPVGEQFDFKWHVCVIQEMTDEEEKERGGQYHEKLRTDDPYIFGRFEFSNALDKMKELLNEKSKV